MKSSGENPTVGSVEQRLNSLLRIELAESWDNVGLLIGDRKRSVGRVMLCVDLTREVLAEAGARRADFVLSYHPPIFDPLRSVLADGQGVIYRAVKADLAVYVVHTAFDMIPGGTSDALADIVELKEGKPIRPISRSGQSKLVVFVPEEQVDRVASAMFAAGAGVIGEYSCCSFRTSGKGTFLGSEKTRPAVGQAGKFESVAEIRLEVLIDDGKLAEVVRRMRKAHPYEEPAFDVYPLTRIEEDCGLGRTGKLARPMKFKSVLTLIKRRTGLKRLVAAPVRSSETIRTAAVCPGSCGKLAGEIAGRVDLYLTGELRHHDALALIWKGTNVVCLGHGNSERLGLKNLSEIVHREFPNLKIFASSRDADPLRIV